MTSTIKAWVRTSCVVLGMAAALVTGGLANTVPAAAQPAVTAVTVEVAPTAIPPCVDQLPPTGGFYRDTLYSHPNPCGKCQAAGGFYESTGRWDAHCQNRYNPAGALTAVQLYLRCIACRTAATVE